MKHLILFFALLSATTVAMSQTRLIRNNGSIVRLNTKTPSEETAAVMSQIINLFDGNEYCINVQAYSRKDNYGNWIITPIYNSINNIYYDAPYVTLSFLRDAAGSRFIYHKYLRFDITKTSITEYVEEAVGSAGVMKLIRLKNTDRKIESLEECNGSLGQQPSTSRYAQERLSTNYYIYVNDPLYRERLLNGLLILKHYVEQSYAPAPSALDRLPEGIAKKSDGLPKEGQVKMTRMAGNTFKVPCTINGLRMNFILDTGASDVSISKATAQYMFDQGYLRREDIEGFSRYSTADGDISVGMDITLRKVNFGGYELKDVKASVVDSDQAPLLLGQSVLSRLGRIQIDYDNSLLTIIRY